MSLIMTVTISDTINTENGDNSGSQKCYNDKMPRQVSNIRFWTFLSAFIMEYQQYSSLKSNNKLIINQLSWFSMLYYCHSNIFIESVILWLSYRGNAFTWNKIDVIWSKLTPESAPKVLNANKSTLDRVMAWRHQAPSHYMIQCWPTSIMSYCVIGHNMSFDMKPQYQTLDHRAY